MYYICIIQKWNINQLYIHRMGLKPHARQIGRRNATWKSSQSRSDERYECVEIYSNAKENAVEKNWLIFNPMQ